MDLYNYYIAQLHLKVAQVFNNHVSMSSLVLGTIFFQSAWVNFIFFCSTTECKVDILVFN